jgi:hypothetical protein
MPNALSKVVSVAICIVYMHKIVRFGWPAGEKRVYFDLAKKPTGAANLRI